MFEKLLIANRGEIACRVIRTARRMGIRSVAVYSDADADALHVDMADESVPVGLPPAAQSYLAIERIVAAAVSTGAEAVHPGYGFLSENPEFAIALENAGIAFVGPPAAAIKSMGDKIAAKKLAAKAGVATVPGHMGLVRSARDAARIAHDIGYPVMIKASAGGGGKGMRIARNEAEAIEGFSSARNEAKSSFADDRVFVEKYIEEPRHIEIQVLADSHGNVIHLGERECSIQRRHQKVIEEAPSPLIDAAMRNTMGKQAVALAREVGYRSAGTVEFIVDRKRNFFFLEMNTRLQVEHPVTEIVTGLDLVEIMIRVAAGEALPFGQEDVRIEGWAIEARIYAEDPGREFLPSIGKLVHYNPPVEDDSLRLDTGVREGSEIGIHYDPMIAKLIASGGNRQAAADRLSSALDAFHIRGVRHNISFLAALIDHPRFREGALSTDFIAEEFPNGFDGRDLPPGASARLTAVAAVAQRRYAEREASITGALAGHERRAPDRFIVLIGEEQCEVLISPAPGGYDVEIGGAEMRLETAWQIGEPILHLILDGEAMTVQIERVGVDFRLYHRGLARLVRVVSPRTAEFAARMPVKEAPDLSKYLLSPMPGLLSSLAVAPGQEVKQGDTLAVVEAMKMENILRAGHAGVVRELHATPGDSLVVDQTIIEFE